MGRELYSAEAAGVDMVGKTSDLERRLGALEERTKQKPKTVLEHVQDWAGVISLLVALLYTFPLGLWDRFRVSPEEQRAQQLSNLRGIVQKLSELDANYGRTANAISDPTARNFYIGAMTAQKAALIAGNIDLITQRYIGLTPSEMELLGYQVAVMGNGPLALAILSSAATASANNGLLAADIYRMKGELYLPGSPLGPDIVSARSSYTDAIKMILPISPNNSKAEAVTIAQLWAAAEMQIGNATCGLLLGQWALAMWQSVDPKITWQSIFGQMGTGNLVSDLGTSRTASADAATNSPISMTSTQGACPSDIVPWRVAQWPWQPINN